MKKVVRANNGQGWVIYDGKNIPRQTYPTKAEALEQLRRENALEESHKKGEI
jgi:hypothetical protein